MLGKFGSFVVADVEVGEGAKCPGNNFRYFGEVLRTKLELVRKEEGGRRKEEGGNRKEVTGIYTRVNLEL
jgi:hypothetical protein